MKKQKRVLMFAKFEAEKIRSTVCQALWKEQKLNLMFTKLSAEKETRMTTTRLKKRRAREQKKWNLLNFITRQINLPYSSYAKFITVKKV